ncbi:ATP-binding cassette domain-containing protein [Candidatus Aerophobetes bacterium]|nr:ATP-binding cassette domain-containing protein [Candidatus Aerophobetes bacterium]
MMEKKEVAVKVHGLTKYYGDFLAVDNVSFEVIKGEIFGFLGPNGAGKTTTIRIVTGILLPDKGKVEVSGIDTLKNPIAAKKIMGVVPEVCNVYVDLSARDNIMLMGKMYAVKRREREERAKELLQKFDLWERKEEKTRRFSRGMKQRLILAMCLIHQPEVLFLDEPTSGLDVKSSRMIRDILQELRSKGKTIFLTTHNIDEANILCDRVAIINKGRIVASDSPEQLKGAFQKTQSVEVSFNVTFADVNWMESIPEVNRCQRLGDKFKLYTQNPDALIKKLGEHAMKNNLHFTSLNTLGPSLEDVFLKLTEERETTDV